MRYIHGLILVLVFPFYLLAKVIQPPLKWIIGLFDYIRLTRRYGSKVLPLSGYQLHRWQMLNKGAHPFYRPIWLHICKRMTLEQRQTFYLSRVMTENGADTEHTADLLTSDNFDTFDFKQDN